MRNITISLFGLHELNKECQQKAIDSLRYINVEHQWWDFSFDHFIELMDMISVSISKESIRFNRFYHQGSGTSFTAVADFTELCKAIEEKAWLSEFPNAQLKLDPLHIPSRIQNLIENNFIEIHSKISSSNRDTSVTGHLIYEIMGKRAHYPAIESCLNQFDNWLQVIADACNKYLYHLLRAEYEHLTMDEAVVESIEANNYEFTIDGKIATHLANLSINK